MRLFGRTTSVNVQKVLWTLQELGITYDQVDLGGAFGGLDTDEYGTMNPNRRVPLLVDGDLTLWESNAIVRYLANSYGGGSLAGTNRANVARADMWMEWFQNNCYAHYIALFHQTVRLPKSQRNRDERDRAIAGLLQSFGMLNTHLEDNRFVAGDDFSMGDIIVGASLFRYYAMDFDRPDLPKLASFYDRLCQRDAYRKTVMTSFDSLKSNEE
jgi:glutathione S-transferase